MRVHGHSNLRYMKNHFKHSGARGSSTASVGSNSKQLVTSGGSIYSEQLSKTVTNMPELSRQFGGLLKKKAKKVVLKL